MSIFQQLNFAQRWDCLKAAATGQWEGYEVTRKRNRPSSRLVSQDTDLDWGTREKLMAESRALGQVFGLPKRILRQYANYCVGDCIAHFQTSDEAWNDLAQENWINWCKMADADGRHQFRQLAKLSLIGMLRDGDSFFQLSEFDGWPYLKAIEADRVTNAVGQLNLDTDKVVGGCVLDAAKRIVSYRVCERDRYGNFIKPQDIARAEMIQLFDPDRFEAYRGVTHFHTALNHLRDMKEIIAAEKTAVKVNSKLALFWQQVTGGIRSGAGVNLHDDPDSESDGKIKSQEVNDGVIAYGFPSENLKAHSSDRPSAAWSGFIDMLIQDIAVGLELPKSFVWTMAGLTGPATRFEGKQAERTFGSKTDILEQILLNRVCGWVTAKSMSAGRLPFNAQWFLFSWQRPSHPTIDVGRESAANLNEHERGVISGLEIAAERGKDIYAVMEQKAREAQYAQELATRYNVPLSAITSMGAKPPAPAEAQQDEEEMPGKGVSPMMPGPGRNRKKET